MFIIYCVSGMHTDTVITAKTVITPGNILPVSHLAILCITI